MKIGEILREILGPKPDRVKIQALKEEAIKRWENKNPEGYKVIRGDNGLPVEMIGIKIGAAIHYGILLNGEMLTLQGEGSKDQFQVYSQVAPILKSQSESVEQFLVCGLQGFNLDGDNQFSVLYGHHLSEILPLMRHTGPIL